MIGKFQDELYQLESKHAKGASDGNWRAKNVPIFFPKHLNTQYQDQTISKLYTDDNKSKYPEQA